MTLKIPILGFLLPLFAACVPVNSCFESARMLHPGQSELRGSCSDYYTGNGGGDKQLTNRNYGFGYAYGVSKRFNLRFRTEIMQFPEQKGKSFYYYDIAGKWSLLYNRIAVEVPLGIYSTGDEIPALVLSPRLFFTPVSGQYFEATLSVKTDFFFLPDVGMPFGFVFGLGISNDLDRWALRPEFGIGSGIGENSISITGGIGFNYNISGNRKK